MNRDSTISHHNRLIKELAKIAKEAISAVTQEKVTSVINIKQGMMTHKFSITTSHNKEYIVRFYPEGRSDVINQEPAIIKRCKDIGLQVPNIILVSHEKSESTLNYIAYEKIEGITLSSYLIKNPNSKMELMAGNLSELINKFELINMDGAGELKNGFEGTHSSWDSFLKQSIYDGALPFEETNILNSDTSKKTQKNLIKFASEVHKGNNSLIWGDINKDNILVNEKGEITGIIDFESCLSGDKKCTLGYFIATLNPKESIEKKLFESLTRNSFHEKETIFFYSLLRAFRLAKYLHLPLPTGRKRDNLIDIFPGLHWAINFYENNTGDYK